MRLFAQLIKTLDSTNKTNVKVRALADYFKQAKDEDKVWAIALLSHKRPSRPVNATLIRQYAAEMSKTPDWLFEECYHIVGDLAETIALIIPNPVKSDTRSLSEYLNELIDLKTQEDDQKRTYLQENWSQMDFYERFVFTKLLTGGFRIGISQKLMTRALSQATGIPEDTLAYRLMGNWDPQHIQFQELVVEGNEGEKLSKPYPFYLAYPIEDKPEELGDISDWTFEYKWDGIRSQVIIRQQEVFIWTRGEELATDRFPELNVLKSSPISVVIDGEILVFKDGVLGSFNDLQTRIGRKNVSKSILKNAPVVLRAYDLLEHKGKDLRQLTYLERRTKLEAFVKETSHSCLQLSESFQCQDWQEAANLREASRDNGSEGLMIKRNDSGYQVGRKKGDWWKWKVDPLTIDGVLTFAMRGHGRRSNLFTDYTFGVWNTLEDGSRELVTFAKAYSGLTDEEFRQVDAFIKKNTLERFGPVRSVEPKLVFEIAFEGIAFSKRHKSGVSLRFPRIARWRHDKTIEDANTLEDLKSLISTQGVN